MKIGLICFSLTGAATGESLLHGLEEYGHQVFLDKKSRYLPDSIKETAGEWAKNHFSDCEGLIFIGACGIAVRSIAPCIVSKKKDPAVLVADECGEFVISLLSGHLGGANALAAEAARILKAVPVITTATDLHHRFAVDVFAKMNECAIFNMKAAKEASAALLAGRKVGFYSEIPIKEELPEGLVRIEDPVENAEPDSSDFRSSDSGFIPEIGIAVTVKKDLKPFKETVHVVPAAVILGIGCKKDTPAKKIRSMAEEALEKLGVYREAVACLASIDLKKEEKGILSLAEEWKIPFFTFSAEELGRLEGSFTPSGFVRGITGVDNVCERSAVLAAGGGRLILSKQAKDGVTCAAARRNCKIRF